MKKLLKSLLVIGCLLVANQSFGATASVTVSAAATTNSLLSAGARVTQVVIANAGTNATTLALLDAPSTSTTFTLSAYTNFSTITTNITQIITTPGGVSQTNTISGVYQVSNPVSASTNTYPLGLLYTIPASSTVTYTPAGNGLLLMRGALLTNGTPGGNLSVTLTYYPQQ